MARSSEPRCILETAAPRPYIGAAMSGSESQPRSDDGARRRSTRIVAVFVAGTIAFATAVGISRCMEADAVRTDAPADRS